MKTISLALLALPLLLSQAHAMGGKPQNPSNGSGNGTSDPQNPRYTNCFQTSYRSYEDGLFNGCLAEKQVMCSNVVQTYCFNAQTGQKELTNTEHEFVSCVDNKRDCPR